ncbi:MULTISPECIES: DUF2332 family protein [Kocuria]|uniref:DUF2332 family protein n=1 Tax=Kocuria TaxID=57493 RepID=UPI0012FCE7DA
MAAHVALALSASDEALRVLEAAPAHSRHPTVVLAALHDLALAGRAPARTRWGWSMWAARPLGPADRGPGPLLVAGPSAGVDGGILASEPAARPPCRGRVVPVGVSTPGSPPRCRAGGRAARSGSGPTLALPARVHAIEALSR